MTEKSEKTITSMCTRDCYDSCSLIVRTDAAGRITKVNGASDHPVTQGSICARGAADPKRVYTNRVLYPYLRTRSKPGRHFERITWDRALDILAQKLQETIRSSGPQSALYADYAGNMGLLTSQYPQRLWHSLGVTRTDHALCSGSGEAGIRYHYGKHYGLPPQDLVKQDLIVLWGFNISDSAPHLWQLCLQARTQTEAKIVVIDPRITRTSRRADLHLRPRPGTDTALVSALCLSLINNQKADTAFIEENTTGFAHLYRAFTYNPHQAAAVTGIPTAQINTLIQWYTQSHKSVDMIGIGFQKNKNGAHMARAVSLISALLGRPRGFYYGNSSAHNIDKDLISGCKNGPIVSQTGLAPLIQAGRFPFIYVSGTNPLITLPDQTALRQGLARSGTFLALHDTHWTETANYADLILPAATHFEKDDLLVPWGHSYIQACNKVIDPLGESKTEINLMQSLARKLECNDPQLYEDPWQVLEKAFAEALENGNFAELRAGKALKLRVAASDQYQTPSGRIEFYSSSAQQAGHPPVPDYYVQEREVGEYILLNSSSPKYTHSQFTEVYGPIPQTAVVNPADAQKEGIEDNQTVRLENQKGSMTFSVKISNDVPIGVLWSPRQSSDGKGYNMNHLTDPTPQAVGGAAPFNSTRVRIRIAAE